MHADRLCILVLSVVCVVCVALAADCSKASSGCTTCSTRASVGSNDLADPSGAVTATAAEDNSRAPSGPHSSEVSAPIEAQPYALIALLSSIAGSSSSSSSYSNSSSNDLNPGGPDNSPRTAVDVGQGCGALQCCIMLCNQLGFHKVSSLGCNVFPNHRSARAWHRATLCRRALASASPHLHCLQPQRRL